MNEGLELLLWLFSNANECMTLLYGHGVWLPLDVGSRAVECGWNFVDARMQSTYRWLGLSSCTSHPELFNYLGTEEGYLGMARWCAERSWPLYRVRPKVHFLVTYCCLAKPWTLNPKSHTPEFYVEQPEQYLSTNERFRSPRKNMENQIDRAQANASSPQYCLNAICFPALLN